MAHHPKVMAGVGTLELASARARLVSARLKHLAELRAGMIAGCEWCLDFGSAISADVDATEDDLRALADYESSDRFSELEKLVLDYATGMSRSPVQVPEDLFRRLTLHLSEAQLVELTNIIALENYRAVSTGLSVWAVRGSLRGLIASDLNVAAEWDAPAAPIPMNPETMRIGACLRSS